MLDSAQLGSDVDFPEINLDKYGWQQYVSLDDDEPEQRCWRADVVVTAATHLPKAVMDKAFKLQIIVAAGEKFDHIDLAACKQRGILVSHVPGLTRDNPENTARICEQVVENINAWIEQKPINLVG